MSLISETKEKLESQAREAGLLKMPTEGDGKKPQLKLPADNRQSSSFAYECGEIIAKRGALFRRDLLPVIPNTEKKRLDTMTPQHFVTWAEQFITFYKERTIEGNSFRVPKSMGIETANTVLACHAFLYQLPEIRRLNPTRMPVIRTNGGLELLKPGYFAEQGIYTFDDGIQYRQMTARRAARLLRAYFREYPLDQRSLAAQIASMLTPYCNCLIERGVRPPCFTYTANSQNAGKTMLAKWAIIPLYGFAGTRALPRYEEARKVLDILALQAEAYVIFDNVKGKIHGEDIEAFLSSPVWSARPLGQSAEYKVENNTIAFFTGNQLDRSQDMALRGLFIELLVREVDSRDRKFKRDIDDSFIAARRNVICSALWALAQDWDAAGRPLGEGVMNKFEKWSRVVPGIVKLAGFGDCLAKPHITGVSDETEDITELVSSLLPRDEEQEAKHDFETLMEKVKELGLFEGEETRGGRRDADLFDKDGRATRAGRSLFGKLFCRYHARKFLIRACAYSFIVAGKGESRRFVVVRE